MTTPAPAGPTILRRENGTWVRRKLLRRSPAGDAWQWDTGTAAVAPQTPTTTVQQVADTSATAPVLTVTHET